MIDHEMTDPAGGALTITHDHQGVWITATENRDEVTVGPFPARTLRASFDMGDDLADGGVTAAAIEAEVVSPERARSLVQENDELRARIGRVEEARDLYRLDVMTAERREQEASDRAEKAERERDKVADLFGAALDGEDRARMETRAVRDAQPRPLTAREHLDAAWEAAHVPAAGCIPAGADYLWRNTASGRICQGIPDDEDGSAGVHGGLVERRLLGPSASSRPEGAEELEAVLSESPLGPEGVRGTLADFLAERGVRVVTEEQP